MMPSSISVLDFAKARVEEIRTLKKDIEDAKYRGARRVFQTLPRSMRRRAASFNIKRLPTRLRLKAIQEMEKDPETVQKAIKKPPCRRRRRRTKNIQEEAVRRQQGKRWLETHIWHAKRAKMVDLWGLRLAAHPNEKCLKACWRAGIKETLLHDASYHCIFQIPTTAIGDVLKADKSSGQVTGMLSGPSGRLICPFRAIIGENLTWIFVHPSAGQEAKEELSRRCLEHGIELVDQTGELNLFELYGPTSQKTLETVLNLSELPTGPLELLVDDPRFAFPPKSDDLAKDFTLSSSIWDAQVRLDSASRRKSEKDLNTIRSSQMIPGTNLVPGEEDPQVPIMILPPPSPAQSWLLILPKDWARPFWRSFVFAKLRFAGFEQIARHTQELGLPAFPFDYPGTAAYARWIDDCAAQLEAKHLARPPAKRVNYEKMAVASPFKPPFPSDACIQLEESDPTKLCDALVQCHLTYTGKGCPEYNAIITAEKGLDKEPLGYVTTGFFSLAKGRGTALATCYAAPLSNIIKAGDLKVWVRNTNSLEFREATLTLLHQ